MMHTLSCRGPLRIVANAGRSQLQPEIEMTKVTMYSSAHCPFCANASSLLQAKGVEQIEKISVDASATALQQMMQLTGRRTVPQIFIGEQHIGGFDDLSALDRAGKLDALLGN